MVIDVHYHPAFFAEACPDENVAQARRESMAYYKTPVVALERIRERIAASGVDRCFLLPHDYRGSGGDHVSNDDVKRIADSSAGLFYPFASVDPNLPDAPKELERAFAELGLCGLKLHPARQAFYPDDPRARKLYDICLSFDKPIIFHGGMTWQPGCEAKYSQPMNFERIAMDYPALRFCIAHFGFPWVRETATLLLKYPNVYADTALLYFDSAAEFYRHVFTREMDVTWLDRSIRHQVMFGANMPRWEQMRMLKALRGLDLREETLELVCERNALEFLGEEKANWLS